MILGVGVDLYKTSRMAKELAEDGNSFRDSIFTPGESAYCESQRYPAQHFAARFAAKEALLKALPGPNLGGIPWREMEILRDSQGRPQMVMHGSIKSIAEQLNVHEVHLSITHTRHLAMAVVILES